MQLECGFDVRRVDEFADGLIDERQRRGERGVRDDVRSEAVRSLQRIEDECLEAGIYVEAEAELRLRTRCENIGHGDEQRAEVG